MMRIRAAPNQRKGCGVKNVSLDSVMPMAAP